VASKGGGTIHSLGEKERRGIEMNKVTKTIPETVLRFVVVHTLILGLFAGMAYLTVEFLFLPTSWPVIVL
jgi:hypothetical protein